MKLNVLYSTDNNYTDIVGISITSLLETNKHFQEITIFIIDCGLGEEAKHILTNLALSYNRKIIFCNLETLIQHRIINAPRVSYYGRLFAPEITEDSKILYLDCDVIVNASLTELWNTELDDYSVAAVQGPGISAENRRKLGLAEEIPYINSGVLLINLEYWRKNSYTQRMLDYLKLHGEIPPYHDQNIINAICYESLKLIHPKYNLLWSMMCCKPKHIIRLNEIAHYYTNSEIEEAIRAPVIIHFSNSIYGRPWKKGCAHPHKKIFEKYKNLSPWKNKMLEKSNLSFLRTFRNWFYRILPSYAYYACQKAERYIIKNVLPHLPLTNLSNFVTTYMNGK